MPTPFDQAQQFTSVWMDYAQKMAQAGMMFDVSKAPPEVARQMRSMAFSAMSQQAEEFMRSPQFLEMMKHSMDAAITFRKQLNDFLTSMQHNVQGVARQDIDSLMLHMRHTEKRVLDAIEQVGDRLESIGRRLDALEAAQQSQAAAAEAVSAGSENGGGDSSST